MSTVVELPPLMRDKQTLLLAGALLVITLLIFWFSPVHQVTDSNYSMLLSQSLLDHQTFQLDHYAIPRLPLEYHDHTWKNGHIHQIQVVDDHFYYYMPPGSSVLSVPFVALMNAFGVSAANVDGSYNPRGEMRIETSLAALLMALLCVTFFLLARLLLPLRWSFLLALSAAFGTQVWSTASRALWADTWGMFLLGIVIYLLLAHETGEMRINPIILATLLAWMYFARPTYSVPILGITIYLFVFHRALIRRYLIVGALWLLGFMAYSWLHFHSPLPQYFKPIRLSFGSLFTAVAGNLVSPSRGLFIYVPVLLFVAYLLLRYKRHIPFPRLMVLSLSVILAFLFVVSAFQPWWAGASYGPRYMAPLVPWFVLLAILGVKGMLNWRDRTQTVSPRVKWILPLTLGSALLILSVGINAIGALSNRAWAWNSVGDIDHDPQQVWNWRYPQLLAASLHPPLPTDFPLGEGRIELSSPESQKFLWYGWSGPEAKFRWTDGREATILFATTHRLDTLLQIKLFPFLVADKHAKQRLEIALNGNIIENLELRANSPTVYQFELPANFLSDRNILTFHLPDAAAPSDFNISADERRLGVAVSWITLQPAKPLAELYKREPVFGDKPAPQFLIFDGHHLELPDNSVDRVMCLDALHHIPNPAEILSEMLCFRNEKLPALAL